MAVFKTIANSNAATKAEIRALTKKPATFLDVTNVRPTTDGYATCVVPTYIGGDDEVVHPSVIYLETAISGYHWWMAATPYSGASSATENPSIFASLDGITWVDPGTNPVVAYPGGTNYNSDTFLWWDNDAGLLRLIWRQYAPPNEHIKLISSADGITWTAETTLWTSLASAYRCVSPSINKLSDGTYIMHSVDILLTPYQLVYQTAATLTGTYSNPVPCTYAMPPGGETDVWHPEVRLTDAGQYLGCIQVDDSSGGPIYMLSSVDGINFTIGSQLSARNTDYKSAFVRLSDTTGVLYLNNIGVRSIIKHGLVFDKEKHQLAIASARINSVALATAGIAGFVHADKFARADNPSSPGTTDSGTAWTVESGTLGIISNELYAPSVANNKCTLTHDSGNIEIFSKLTAVAGDCYIIFRYQDASNFWRLHGKAGSFHVQAIVAGGIANQYDIGQITLVDNDEFVVRLLGNQISILLNEIPVFSLRDSRFEMARKAGLQISDTIARVSDFYIREL